jgi:creatinine amidohydrolase
MQLQLQTWSEVEKYLETNTTVIIPIGSTEQHGPNGLIGTDALTAEAVSRAAGEKAGIMVAPTISVGMAQHHMAFTGSMTLKPATMLAVIKDYVDSLRLHGFSRIYFINGHGGNIATVNAAFQEIYAEQSLSRGGSSNRPKVTCKLRNWWEGESCAKFLKSEFADKDGSHATISEVSMTQFLFPDAIKSAPDMGPPSKYRGPWSDADDYRAKFPDGRIGSHPYLASPEAGKKVFDTAVADTVKDIKAFAGATG